MNPEVHMALWVGLPAFFPLPSPHPPSEWIKA
jgi:hypothetical protein